MKAMLLRHIAPVDSSPLEWTDLPTPEPAPGEVRIRVHCCAVCRTDLHVIEGDLPQEKMPIIPGHQIVGIVDKLGPPLAVRPPSRLRLRSPNNRHSNSASGSAWRGSVIRVAVRFLHQWTRKPLRVGPFHRLSRRRRIRRIRRGAGGVCLSLARGESPLSHWERGRNLAPLSLWERGRG